MGEICPKKSPILSILHYVLPILKKVVTHGTYQFSAILLREAVPTQDTIVRIVPGVFSEGSKRKVR